MITWRTPIRTVCDETKQLFTIGLTTVTRLFALSLVDLIEMNSNKGLLIKQVKKRFLNLFNPLSRFLPANHI